MGRAAVIDASPLIFLSRAKQIDLLRHFASRLLVPDPVASEIRKKGPDDITAQALEMTPWLEIVPGIVIPETILG